LDHGSAHRLTVFTDEKTSIIRRPADARPSCRASRVRGSPPAPGLWS